MSNTWYAIKNAAEPEAGQSTKAEISIYDEIGGYGVGGKEFAEQLNALDVDQIDLRISSPGGSIIEGNLIFNELKRHKANITVYVDSLAASMGSVIAMAGDEIVMADNALLMIHNPWTVSIGDSEQLRKDADLMDKMKSAIVNAYSRSNYSTEELEELMNETTWLTAQEALDAGFIDRIETGLQAAASIADMQAIAAKADTALPMDKVLAGIFAKHDEETRVLNAELTSANDQLAQNAEQISGLQSEAQAFTDRINEMDTKHKAELEASSEVTEAAVAAKAAELMALQTASAVVDSGKKEMSDEEILSQYSSFTNREERAEFFKAHKTQILRAQTQ